MADAAARRIALALAVLWGCAATRPAVVPISTASPEARRLYLSAKQRAGEDRGDEARALVRQALALDDSFAQAHALLAELSEGEEASRQRARAAALARSLPEAERLLVEVRVGVKPQAALGRVLELAPDDVAVMRELAEGELYTTLDKPAARAAFERLLAHVPGDADAHKHLAFLHADAERWPDARAHAARFAQLTTNRLEGLAVVGELALAAGDLAAAEQAFRAAHAADGAAPDGVEGLAAVAVARGDVAGAIAALGRAADQAASPALRARLTTTLGWTLALAGRFDEARAALREGDAPRRAERGYSVVDVELALEIGDWPAAARAAQEARASVPADAWVGAKRWVDLLALVAAAGQGDSAGAAQILEQLQSTAAGLEPWLTKDVSFGRGWIALAQGDADGAAQAFADKWVVNHNSYFDPGRARPQSRIAFFALEAKRLAAEALLRAGRADAARDLLEPLVRTHRLGTGAALVRARAAHMLRALPPRG